MACGGCGARREMIVASMEALGRGDTEEAKRQAAAMVESAKTDAARAASHGLQRLRMMLR